MTLRRAVAIVVAGLVLAACAGPSTTLDQTWTAPTAQNIPSLQKVVVMFVSGDITTRHSGEDHLVRDLAARRVTATPGYAIFGDQSTADLEAVKVKLRDMGYDGVVTMRIIDRSQEVEYVPATFDAYWGFWGYDYWGYGYWPGNAYTETIYRIETAVYSLHTGRLVWSAVTKTVDPDTSHELIDDTTEVIAGELTRRGLAG